MAQRNHWCGVHWRCGGGANGVELLLNIRLIAGAAALQHYCDSTATALIQQCLWIVSHAQRLGCGVQAAA
jgi:hypothetical protein